MTTLESAPAETPTAVDPEEVAGRVVAILNDGAICLLTSLGHELGLDVDVLAVRDEAPLRQIAGLEAPHPDHLRQGGGRGGEGQGGGRGGEHGRKGGKPGADSLEHSAGRERVAREPSNRRYC